MKKTTIADVDYRATLTPNEIVYIKNKLYFFVDRARELRYGQAKLLDGTILENHAYHVTLYILRDAAGRYKVCDGQQEIKG